MEERKNYAAILVAAVRAPFRDPDWIKKILIGGLLSPLPVVNFLTWGYAYRIFVDGLNGAPELLLPAWQDWRSFFRVGFWIFLRNPAPRSMDVWMLSPVGGVISGRRSGRSISACV